MSTKTIAVLDHADLKDGEMYEPNRATHVCTGDIGLSSPMLSITFSCSYTR